MASKTPGALAAAAKRCSSQLDDVVGLVRTNLSKMSRTTLSSLVVMDVHARDTTAALVAEDVQGQPNHFSWLSQLRMYWEDMRKDKHMTIPVSKDKHMTIPVSKDKQL
jgi:dynein heavy chain, axonemal